MVSYDDLIHVDLSALDRAATSIEAMIRTWPYDSDFASGVAVPLAASEWTGQAADAAATQLAAARTQIDEAFTETSALSKALREAHDQLVACQKTALGIQHDAAAESLTISADGTDVTWITPPEMHHDPQGYTDYQRQMRARAESIAARVKAVTAQATQIDQETAAALVHDTGSNSSSFNRSPVGGVTEEAGQQAANLLRQGSRLTDAQVAQLDALLKAHAGDPAFATAFYDDLGPSGFLSSLGSLDVGASHGGSANRLGAVTRLQALLGTALATATDTRHWPHLSDSWETGLRRAGATRYPIMSSPEVTGVQPYGYQILASVLRTGHYDAHFLLPVAEHVTQLSETDPQMWSKPIMQAGGPAELSFPGAQNNSDYNPMSGVLEALGHSPNAATRFFDPQRREILYGFDGAPTGHTAANTYLQQLTSDHFNSILQDISPTAPFVDGKASPGCVTALGHALQSATTGASYDATSGVLPQHSAGMSRIVTHIVKTFGSDSQLLKGTYAPLDSSLGHIVASYIGDVQKAMPGAPSNSSTYGVQAALDPVDTGRLLYQLGSTPDAYGSIIQAQQAYTAAQVHQVLLSRSHHSDISLAINNSVQAGGVTAGFLNRGRADATYQSGLEAVNEYNQRIDANAGYAKQIWEMTAGSSLDGESQVVGILGNATGSHALDRYDANGQVNKIIDGIADSYKQPLDKVVNQADGQVVYGQENLAEATRHAVQRAAMGTGMSGADIADVSQGAAQYSISSYQQGWNDATYDSRS